MARIEQGRTAMDWEAIALANRIVDSPDRAAGNGTSGNDRLLGTENDDYFDMSAGGRDSVRGLGGDDYVDFGVSFDARDSFNGGDGLDAVSLTGAYDLTINGSMLNGVEEIDLEANGSYDLTLAADLGDNIKLLTVFSYQANLSPVSIDASAMTVGLALFAGGGDTTFIAGTNNDLLRARATGTAMFDGGAGFDRISLFGLGNGVTFDLGAKGAQQVANASITISNIEDVSGTTGADTLTGSSGDNWFLANGGNDTISGLAGDDLISIGRDGTGTAATAVTVDGGRGFDTLDLSGNGAAQGGVTVSLALSDFQNAGEATIKLTGIEAVTGTTFADSIEGDRAANTLFGNDGADTLTGGAGNDTLYGDAFYGLDSPNGFDGPRMIFDNADAAFDDILDGGTGNDRLFGGGGSDTLTGGVGQDDLTGGAGADLFRYTATRESVGRTVDRITDFVSGDDRIDVSAIDADTTARRDQAFHFGATDGHAGDLIVRYDASSNTTFVDLYTDGDGNADMTIALAGNIPLTANDFVL